tara:strand:- start:8867 stop:10273 length:1407 start_codon:yes stop_codon:yes gene_type:complete
MANIGSISGVLASAISSIDGIAKSAISAVDGVLFSVISTLIAIIAKGTANDAITSGIQGTSGNSSCGKTVQLDLGKYITFNGQLTNANNQNVLGVGITQSDLTLTTSSSVLSVYPGTADLDPYGRGQAMGACKLNSNQALVCSPSVGVGNVFKVLTYSGGTNALVIDATFNDGDSANLVDRFPNFQLLKVSGTVYTVASTGLSRGGAFPYARVWDIDISGSGSATSRGIIYPMGTGPASGNGKTNLCYLGTVGGKECFAIFYAKSTSGAGVAYYAVYEYNTSTNTLVETVGDTLYKSGSNSFEGFVDFKIEDGRGPVMFVENSVGYIAGAIYDGTSFSVGSSSTWGTASDLVRFPGMCPYYNGQENSTSQFIIGNGKNSNASGQTAKFNVFPVNYNSSSNQFDTSKYNTSDSEDVLEDSATTTTFSGAIHNPFIGTQNTEFGSVVTTYRDSVGTFRGQRANAFKMSKT